MKRFNKRFKAAVIDCIVIKLEIMFFEPQWCREVISYQHNRQIAWKSIIVFPQFVEYIQNKTIFFINMSIVVEPKTIKLAPFFLNGGCHLDTNGWVRPAH